MNKLNIKSRTQTRKIVEPSTRDSISTWLDVLTAMLVMPDTQRLQVRDELEDHLRSRVDDLLIMGKSEPEAIRIAVAELGETAELAKLITHAHTKSNPRRKIMNAALITVALAGMSFGGFTFITGTGAPSATPSNGGAVPVVIPEEARKEITQSEPQTRMVIIEHRPLLFTIQQVASDFGYTLNAQSLSGIMVSDMQRRFVSVNDEYTIEGVMQYLIMSSLQHASELTTEINGDVIELLTQDELIRRSVTTSVNPAPSWIKDDNQRAHYAESIRDLLRVKHDLEFTSIQIIGKSFVVAAPPEVQAEVIRIARELNLITEREYAERAVRMKIHDEEREAQIKARREEQAVRSLTIAQEKKAKQQEAIGRIQVEFDRVRKELSQKKAMMRELQSKLKVLNHASDPELTSRRHVREISELENALGDTELLYEEYRSRYNYLRDTLIESEYTALFKGLE